MLYHVNEELSEKWIKLWKLYIISIVVTIGGAVLALLGIIGLLITLVGAVLILIVSIKQLIYLYNTAKQFKEM